MNRILVFLLITLSTLTVFGQNFEGQITYSNTYKSQNPKMTGQQWLKMMGDTQNYSIKNGNYKAISNGSMFQWLIYVNSENMLYTKMANSEIALWNDGMVNADTVLNAVVNKNVINILGYDCDELILTCKSGIQKYYLKITNSEIGMLF
jgi:hypothetical protein